MFIDNFVYSIEPKWLALIPVLVYMLTILVLVPLMPVLGLYVAIRVLTQNRLSARALSLRLWRILGGIALLVALNYLSLWLEQQPWLRL